ncbi:hypothetical protein OTU49_000119 [Cherax quadricarinatus]|uniref:Uncharacterized protein n=1 Tax=Cherax quadricarinatus TaxID=27406 RepID=A0AAW0XSI5_CHEQU
MSDLCTTMCVTHDHESLMSARPVYLVHVFVYLVHVFVYLVHIFVYLVHVFVYLVHIFVYLVHVFVYLVHVLVYIEHNNVTHDHKCDARPRVTVMKHKLQYHYIFLSWEEVWNIFPF